MAAIATAPPQVMSPLFHLFYVSETTTGDARDITAIGDESQANNARDDITGLLLFDGKYWCQYIEGSERAVDDLLGRLRRDPRHRHMRLLQHGPAGAERMFPNWRMGYAFIADENAIRSVLAASGANALDVFSRIDRSGAQEL